MGAKQNSKKNTFFWIPVKKNKVHVNIKPKPKKYTTQTTFLDSLRFILMTGQAFSLLPVVGIRSNKTEDIRYVRFSWISIYAVLSFCGQLYMTIMCMVKVFNETTLESTTPVVFYGSTLFTMYMFYRVALGWPTLIQHIVKTEELDPNFDIKLPYRCKITCTIVLFLSLFEHILSLLSAFAGAMMCYPDSELYEGFVKYFYPWVFNFLPYSPVLGFITQFLHFQSTFIWNFSDLFVICMSYYLTSRLEQVNRRLLAAQGKYLPEVFWRTSREDYCRVTQLVRRVDDVISGVVFISFANNLFFICLQLFNSLDNGIKGTETCSHMKTKANATKSNIFGGYEAAAYFIFSLVYLIARSVAVSLIASQVNSASSVPAPVLYDVPSPVYCIEVSSTKCNIFVSYEAAAYSIFSLVYLIARSVAVSLIASQVNSASSVPAPVLYDVPSPVYCIEVQRFLDQVNGDKVALSGLQFFTVTRGLLLTIAGTIVTYELVMVQFNSSSSPPVIVNTTAATLIPQVGTTEAIG